MSDQAELEAMEPEKLAGKLARYPGPRYRKAYLADLLASGNRFRVAGNARGAGYCFAKVAQALASVPGGPDMPEAAGPAEADGMDASASTDLSSDLSSGPKPAASKPRAPRAKAPEKPISPTERFRRQWRLERIKDAEQVLFRHSDRLSALEKQSYGERLERMRQSALAITTSAQSDRLDAGLLDLRRRLYQRVLKSQKISLSRRRMPVTLARLALPPAQPAPRNPSGLPALPAPPEAKAGRKKAVPPAAKVQVDSQWQPVTGPYNDRYNMEELLSLIAEADAAWVQEFLDLFRGLAGLPQG